jgi:hypothetical protein
VGDHNELSFELKRLELVIRIKAKQSEREVQGGWRVKIVVRKRLKNQHNKTGGRVGVFFGFLVFCAVLPHPRCSM